MLRKKNIFIDTIIVKHAYQVVQSAYIVKLNIKTPNLIKFLTCK